MEELDSPPNHLLYSCPCFHSETLETWDEYKEWRQQLIYQEWHKKICWMYHVPQLNNQLHQTFKKAVEGRLQCRHADIIALAAFAIYHTSTLCQVAGEHFGRSWNNLKSFATWLMEKPREGSESNLMDLFMWYSSYDV